MINDISQSKDMVFQREIRFLENNGKKEEEAVV